MGLVSSTIPNLVNGVSQQPDSLRLTSQCELQENGYSSVVKGVRKRAPFRHLAKLSSSAAFDSAYLHTINRDATERYVVVITNGDLAVYDLAGNAKTVNFPNGKAYLTNLDPASGFVALTVADYTFITNKAVVPAMAATLSPTRQREALVSIRQGGYGMTYTVTVNIPGVGTYTATKTTSTTAVTDISTVQIATDLAASLNAAFPSGVTCGTYGSVLHIIDANIVGAGVPRDFTITTSDGLSDRGMVAIKDSIQRFTDLPVKGVNGVTVYITGDQATTFDDYYVKWLDANTSSGSGSWVETTAMGIKNTIDATTMPWTLVRNGDGTFTFDKVAWAARGVGDNSSAPEPSFIGQPISDIFFHRNRLGFLTGENVVLSKAGSFFQFWPDTCTAVLDSDPIDVAATHTKVSTLRAVAPFNDNLLLFSDQTQFILSGGDLLTPKTVSIKPASEFENSSATAKPVSTGKNAYFTVSRGAFTGLREYRTLAVSDQKDADETTAHVPQYVPSGVFKIASTSNENVLALLTKNERNAVYVYKYYWNGDSKLQSAWSKWVFDAADKVLNIDFIQTDAYALIQRADGLYLEVSSLELGRQDAGFPFQVNLDRRCTLTGAYNAGTNTTTWTLPYADAGTVQVVLGAAFTNRLGTVLTTTRPSNSTIAATGDFSAGTCYVGRAYTFRYRFSKQVVREQSKGGGQQANTEGRLQLNRFSVGYEQTGYFRAEVTPYARTMQTYQFTGYITGDGTDVIGTRPVPDGVFRFPVMSEARTVIVDLVNDTYLPSSFQQAGWEAKYFVRSARI
jgi:hypothetical protein